MTDLGFQNGECLLENRHTPQYGLLHREIVGRAEFEFVAVQLVIFRAF